MDSYEKFRKIYKLTYLLCQREKRKVGSRSIGDVLKLTALARLVGRVASLYENITSRVVRAPELGMYFDRSVEWGLRGFYRGLSMASIRGVKLNISILVPELGKAVNLTVDIGREALANLMQRLPARIVHYRLMG